MQFNANGHSHRVTNILQVRCVTSKVQVRVSQVACKILLNEIQSQLLSC